MKHLIAAIGILITSWMMTTAQTQAVKGHDLSLKGVVVPANARGTLMIVGKSEGSLPGSFEISIWYNPVTNKITGGTWKLILSQPGRASKAQGALAGSIEGGTVTLDKHGKVSSAEGLQINIRRSAGQYSHVTKGSGKLKGTLNLHRQHPFVGELNISFK